jgi:hypothetical protein
MKIDTTFNTAFHDVCLYSKDIEGTIEIDFLHFKYSYVFCYLGEREVIIPTQTNKKALKLYVITKKT